jgi:hypothetical protein
VAFCLEVPIVMLLVAPFSLPAGLVIASVIFIIIVF